MGGSKKKQRHEAKRAAKRKEMRRRDSVSPFKRVVDGPGMMRCFATSEGFEFHGQCQVMVYKMTANTSAFAAFLIDQGVVGLKDAWTRVNMSQMELAEILDKCTANDLPMEEVSVECAKKWIAGGVRWAHDHGMRLPAGWVKAASLLGGIPNWASADISLFKKEFAGHPEDLRRRLMNEPFDDFVRRTDIQFIFSDRAPILDFDDEEEEFDEEIEFTPDELENLVKSQEEILRPIVQMLVDETTQWLTSRGERPAEQLNEVWLTMLMGSACAQMVDSAGRNPGNLVESMANALEMRIKEPQWDSYVRAKEQINRHMDDDPKLLDKLAQQYKAPLAESAGADSGELT